MAEIKRYTVTSALPYTNGPVHIGQLSGAYVPADIYVRYLRMRYGKENVLFVCGSDEHGVAITMTAKKEGISPQEVADKYNAIIKKSFEDFGIDFNIYHRTSAQLHHETAAEFFKSIHDKGEYFLEKETEQYFDVENNQFLADRYITGTCPNCGNEKAYGDQCEKCGSTLSPNELISPKSTISGNSPIKKKTSHWYFKLDAFQSWLEEWIEEKSGQEDRWKKHVLGQCRSWLEAGLRPRAITRDIDWGIKVPLENAEGKVLYVWFDAPIGYISATKAWAEKEGLDWEPFWKDESTKLVHFIGKDNIVFHTLMFPAMLKAEGSYILPTNVPANQFMNMEGEKMSTSRNWTVWLHEYLEDLPGKQDELRYCLTMNMPENKDSDFNWQDFQDRTNNELVANLGNFVNRIFVLSHKYFDGKLQSYETIDKEVDKALINEIAATYHKVAGQFEKYDFKQAMLSVLALSSAGNKYLADLAPWKLIKTDEKRTAEILNVSAQLVYHLAILLKPLLPFSSKKMAHLLNVDIEDMKWHTEGEIKLLPTDLQLNKPELLFEKIEDSVIQAQKDKLEATKLANQGPEQIEYAKMKETIQYDDFIKLDIRTGTVKEAVKVPKSSKLLQLTVDLGMEERTILSGISKHFTVEEVIGKQVCVLINLAPRMMMGIESNGMVLMAEDNDGKLKFISPTEAINNGMTIS